MPRGIDLPSPTAASLSSNPPYGSAVLDIVPKRLPSFYASAYGQVWAGLSGEQLRCTSETSRSRPVLSSSGCDSLHTVAIFERDH